MYLRYRLIAHELRDLGIDSNCAPLVDVAGPKPTHFAKPLLRHGCRYRSDVWGARWPMGLLDGGVLPVLKHIPGHGRAVADSHLELPAWMPILPIWRPAILPRSKR
ncbi:MAG: glycoside hydrolase family 3 N-terminal domain-containing protein [Thalassovita sp.]